MKKLLFLLTILIEIFSVSAQNTITITGSVIDNGGNPLPGASISATNGAETTLTESDGTFVIEIPVYLNSLTTTYPGFFDNKKKISNEKNLIFKMIPKNSKHGYLNIAVGFYETLGLAAQNFSNYYLGLEGGLLANWGFYAKIMFPLKKYEDYGFSNYKTKLSTIKGSNAIIGVIKGFRDKYFLKLGVGYGAIEYRYRGNNSYKVGKMEWDPGFAIDLGANFKLIDHFNFGLGFTFIYKDTAAILPNLTAGYVF